jgi:D-methionine transport system ATP-binding protein
MTSKKSGPPLRVASVGSPNSGATSAGGTAATPTTAPAAPIIRFAGVSKKFTTAGGASVAALQDVTLEVRAGEVLGIIGRSGAGKSTLIRCINGLERPQAGSIVVDGIEVAGLDVAGLLPLRRRIGMIFQHFNLLSSRTVFGNVALPLELAGVPRAGIAARVERLLDLVGLADKRDVYPAKLSGGQKQRVGIARALATEPAILLCDEATSALDPETTRQILALLGDINRKLGLTIVLITHEMSVIRDLCDRVVVLDSGRVVEEGAVVDIFVRPQSPVTRSLLQEVLPQLPDDLATRLSPEPGPGSQALLRLTFAGAGADAPVIAELARRLDVAASVIQGTIDHIKDAPFGVLVLALPAITPVPLDDIVAFLRARTSHVEVLGHVAPAH